MSRIQISEVIGWCIDYPVSGDAILSSLGAKVAMTNGRLWK